MANQNDVGHAHLGEPVRGRFDIQGGFLDGYIAMSRRVSRQNAQARIPLGRQPLGDETGCPQPLHGAAARSAMVVDHRGRMGIDAGAGVGQDRGHAYPIIRSQRDDFLDEPPFVPGGDGWRAQQSCQDGKR